MGDHSFWTAVELVQWTGIELLANTTEDYDRLGRVLLIIPMPSIVLESIILALPVSISKHPPKLIVLETFLLCNQERQTELKEVLQIKGKTFDFELS